MKANEFKKYWDKKSQKRRKSWEGKLKRRIANHTPIEEIRKDVFKPFCQTPNFDGFCELAESHYTTKNPLAEWRGGKFCFSEVGLRDALLQYGGKLDEFTATREHSVCERRHFTDLDAFTFTYGEATMIIKRYAAKDVPFGRYEITPCTRFDDNCPMRMEETGFYTLNIATLLMEMDAECHLREEEFLYYVKGQKIAGMEGTVADAIEFNLWDDAKIAEKVKSLVKRYVYINVETVIKSALKPWMSAVKEFMEKITHADKDREGLIFRAFERSVRTGNFVNTPEGYINNVFRPYLDSQGLQDAIIRANGSSTITLEYQGCQLMLKAGSPYAKSPYQCHFYPFAEENDLFSSYIDFAITFELLTLSAIARYMKLMPKYKDIVYGMKEKVCRAFDEIE